MTVLRAIREMTTADAGTATSMVGIYIIVYNQTAFIRDPHFTGVFATFVTSHDTDTHNQPCLHGF